MKHIERTEMSHMYYDPNKVPTNNYVNAMTVVDCTSLESDKLNEVVSISKQKGNDKIYFCKGAIVAFGEIYWSSENRQGENERIAKSTTKIIQKPKTENKTPEHKNIEPSKKKDILEIDLSFLKINI